MHATYWIWENMPGASLCLREGGKRAVREMSEEKVMVVTQQAWGLMAGRVALAGFG